MSSPFFGSISILLEIDEAQDVAIDKYDRESRPDGLDDQCDHRTLRDSVE